MADAALTALAETTLRLVRSTTSGRLALAALREAVDPDALPPASRGRILAELDRAAASALEPLSAKAVESALRSAWGTKPKSVLDGLDLDAPVAVTPTSQVHRAELDGRAVAVKVLRPGLAETVRSDLSLADALVRPLGAAFPRLDPAALVREARERVLDELDLEHEGSAQRAFARALRRHPALHVPAVHSEHTHPGVLVSDWVDGRPVLEAAGTDQAPAVARALVAFHVGGARFGTVHADPHPSNALLMDDGRVAVVDFGATRQVDRSRVDRGGAALDALLERDGSAVGTALDALGWLPAEQGTAGAELAHALLDGHLEGPSRLDGAALRAVADRTRARAQEVYDLALTGALPPEDLWPLRMMGALVALLARLGVTEDWPALVRAAVRDGFDAA